MRVVITSDGVDHDSAVDPLFGRCAYYVFADSGMGSLEAHPNPAASAPSGAGIVAAQYVIEQGARAVLSGNVGPNALDVFQANDIPVYNVPATLHTVGQALEAFRTGALQPLASATVGAHQSPIAEDAQRQQKIATLTNRARELRQELAAILDEIETLEKEN
jgi:predicted Fe-Mo cluster-binding NifX family protein